MTGILGHLGNPILLGGDTLLSTLESLPKV